jgi:hypothetical protein
MNTFRGSRNLIGITLQWFSAHGEKGRVIGLALLNVEPFRGESNLTKASLD